MKYVLGANYINSSISKSPEQEMSAADVDTGHNSTINTFISFQQSFVISRKVEVGRHTQSTVGGM